MPWRGRPQFLHLRSSRFTEVHHRTRTTSLLLEQTSQGPGTAGSGMHGELDRVQSGPSGTDRSRIL